MAFDTSESLTQSDFGDELAPGTTLFHGQYRITRFINSGGFGITYLAKDSLDRDVVIKECFSSTFCRRTESRVRARSQGTKEHMHRIVRSFLNEARSLAKVRHPNIVGVHQVFEDNDTAYMALDYIRGHDLLEIIDEKKRQLKPEQIVAMTAKLVAATVFIHKNDLLHCDISPDNIFITHEGEPILIDFGAARRSASGEALKYSGLSVVKDGYSPHELYTPGGNSGPWSDIYALAASLYHAISGTTPVNCQMRLSALAAKQPDPCTRLAGSVDGYPPGFLESIDKAMSVMPAARFQSAQDWLNLLSPLQERKEKKVVLLRRIVPTNTVSATEPPPVVTRSQERPTLPVRPHRISPTLNGADLSRLNLISGFVSGCLVNGETGEALVSEGKDKEAGTWLDAHLCLAKANFEAIDMLDPADRVEDIMISIGNQLHLIRPLAKAPKLLLCVVMDREGANPALARVQLRRVEQSLAH
ncbi:MAG: serine/threonine protein kinase [Tabrizicola sp.]|nr:serine/threonine protein kinase [Tabrizicola sp.]